MDTAERSELAEIMGRLAAGDRDAVFDLRAAFGDKVAGTVRAVLRARGLALVHDEVDGLVLDACVVIRDVAPTWSATGGAAPWVYARRRIENLVDRFLGQHTVPLDDHREAVERLPATAARVTSDDRSSSSVFETLVAVDERCRLLSEAFDAASVSAVDRAVWVQYAVECAGGNRAPAAAVGAQFDLRDATVRQRVRRSKRRVQRVAASDARFAPLTGLRLLT